MTNFKIYPGTVINLVICTGCILLFILFVVYPVQNSITHTDQRIDSVKKRIEEQKIFYPVYKNLLKQLGNKIPKGIFAGNSGEPAQYDSTNITLLIQKIATENNLEVVSIIYDVGSLIDDFGDILIDASVSGAFQDFRNFLTGLYSIYCLSFIEEIEIKEFENSRNLLLGLKIRFSGKLKEKGSAV